MTGRTSYNIPGHVHYLTFSCYRQQQLLTDDTVRSWLAETINRSRQDQEYNIYAYVIMPEHVHLISHPLGDKYSISSILRGIKGPFARRVTKHWQEHAPDKLKRVEIKSAESRGNRFWQAGGGYDRNIYTYQALNRAIEYIEFNPVRRGLVDTADDWVWSSARARSGVKDVPLAIDAVLFHEGGEPAVPINPG